MNLKYAIVSLIFCFFASNPVTLLAQSDELTSSITAAIKNTDASKLSSYFNSTIDLELENTEGSYSKTQAEMMIRDFFKSNPLTSYSVNHQGDSTDGSKYIIGTYKTASKRYRLYILIKKQSNEMLIHQLQFEIED
jgi:hypothetical protein